MNFSSFLSASLACGLLAVRALAADPANVTLKQSADRVRVELNGQLFTEYVFADGASRPYSYPVLAYDGTSLTRDFPMKETPGEDRDHKHHRALMFAHSDANQIDFWNEGTAGTKFPKGNTVHEKIIESKSGKIGTLKVRNRWDAPDGRVIAHDTTTMRFHGEGDARFIDYEVTIEALPDQPLVMGDNKDGTMAIRIAQWMTLPHKMQGKDVPGSTGHIETAAGHRDADAWGKRADWCDYSGTHEGKVYGIAIFDHPQNLRHPTWWMARDYGLFAANPFGWHDFEKEFRDNPRKGEYTIPAGGTLTLRYRFYFHPGDATAAKVAAHYTRYAQEKKP